MSLFTPFEHFFEKLFGKKNADAAEKVLHGVSDFVVKAEPIVADVEAILKAAPATGTIHAIAEFIAKYEPDVMKAAKIAATLAPLTGPELFKTAAVAALSIIAPGAGIAPTSLLNLAVELAYSIFKQQAATAPAAPKAA